MSDPCEYTVGWICALSLEFTAARSFLDKEHPKPASVADKDGNNYALGRIGSHNIVIAVLPHSEIGVVSAATVGRDMLHSFPNVRIGLMVGIAGGVPSVKHDVRLGDVVVSGKGSEDEGDVLQHDFGKRLQTEDGNTFQYTGYLERAPRLLRAAVNGLATDYELEGHQLEDKVEEVLGLRSRLRKRYARPKSSSDRLYASNLVHPADAESCLGVCDTAPDSIVQRAQRDEEDQFVIHHGRVASGNSVVKSALDRDALAEKDIVCVEMESAGLRNHFPCLVVRGICDYSDSHKNKEWQGFAAMMAAAYAKDLLLQIAPSKIQAEKQLAAEMGLLTETVSQLKLDLHTEHSQQRAQRVRNWLSAPETASSLQRSRELRHEGSGAWLLNENSLFRQWMSGEGDYLWLHGQPGCGKTVLSTTVYDYLLKNSKAAIIYFFNFNEYEKRSVEGMVRSLVFQLYTIDPQCGPSSRLYALLEKDNGKLSKAELTDCLVELLDSRRGTCIMLDALDECEARNELLTWLKDFLPRIARSSSKLWATSRPESEFQIDIPGFIGDEDCLAIDRKAVDIDIRCFVAARLLHDPAFTRKSLSEGIKDRILSKVGDKADGMFRWAACQLDELAQCTSQRHMEVTLESLPKDLDSMHSRLMSEVPDNMKADSNRLLQFLVYYGPLSVPKAMEIVATRIGPGETQGLQEKYKPFGESELMAYFPRSMVFVSEPDEWVDNDDPGYPRDSEDKYLFQMSSPSAKSSTCGKSSDDLDLQNDAQDAINANVESSSDCSLNLDIHEDHRSDAKLAFPIPMSVEIGEQMLFDFHSRKLRIAHFSVAEFLRQCPDFSELQASITITRTFLTCIQSCEDFHSENPGCLIQDERLNGLNTLGYPLYAEALSRWPTYGRLSESLQEERDFVLAHLQFRPMIDNERPLAHGNMLKRHLLMPSYQTIWQSASEPPMLFIACLLGLNETCRFLLADDHEDVDSERNFWRGISPLRIACHHGHIMMVEQLLKVGADPNAASGDFEELGTALFEAVRIGREDIVQLLLNHGADVSYGRGRRHDPPIVEACHNFDMITLLLSAKTAEVSLKEGNILPRAVHHGISKDSLTLLLERGAKVNAYDVGSQYATALQAASSRGKFELSVVDILLDWGADVNDQTGTWGGSLHIAAARNDMNTMQKLIRNGANVNVASEQVGTPLHVAVASESLEAVKLLLSEGAEIESRGIDGETALALAVEVNRPDIVEVLLDSGADVNAEDDQHVDALHCALQVKGHLPIVEMLVARGASIHVNSKAASPKNALYAAVGSGDEDLISYVVQQGVEVNEEGDKYGHALYLCVKYRLYEAAKLLVRMGSHVDTPGVERIFSREKIENSDPESLPMVDHHRYRGRKERLSPSQGQGGLPLSIIRDVADPEDTLDLFKVDLFITPLYEAVQRRSLDMVHFLLDAGADASKLGGASGTPLDLARILKAKDKARLRIIEQRGFERGFYKYISWYNSRVARDQNLKKIVSVLRSHVNG